MAKRKPTNKYYFSVEGETEQWYLKWLQDTINNTEKVNCMQKTINILIDKKKTKLLYLLLKVHVIARGI